MMQSLVRLIAASIVLVAALIPCNVWAQASCVPSWSPLGAGTTGAVSALAVFDDGAGSALYTGGNFTTAGGVTANRLARWDGSVWSPVGSGMDRSVSALTVFDDGAGPALYAGGSFSAAGGVAVNNIAKWDGSVWSPLGSGLDGWVSALEIYDDGSGPALYAGGGFRTAGGDSANRIARWDGSSWSPLGSGLNGGVTALQVYDDGSGPALYAGGAFTAAGGASARGIARWDGSSWSPLGSGLNDDVYTLAVYDDGSGPALYAGGYFSTAGGMAASNIARWDGTRWAAVGEGVSGGKTWIDPYVAALATFNAGSGGESALYAAGVFTRAGDASANSVARWDGEAWSPVASLNDAVASLIEFDDGAGPALYAGGWFTTVDYVSRFEPASSTTCITPQLIDPLEECYARGTAYPAVGTPDAGAFTDSVAPFFAESSILTSSGFGDEMATGSARLTMSIAPGDLLATVSIRGSASASVAATGAFGRSWAFGEAGTGPDPRIPVILAIDEPLYFSIVSEVVDAEVTVTDAGGTPLAGDRLEPGNYRLIAYVHASAEVEVGESESSASIDWTLRLSRTPLNCYADCDGSGSLDFFDFLCFQNLFAAGDPEADCDESGALDFFDFLCFQNAFAAGCP